MPGVPSNYRDNPQMLPQISKMSYWELLSLMLCVPSNREINPYKLKKIFVGSCNWWVQGYINFREGFIQDQILQPGPKFSYFSPPTHTFLYFLSFGSTQHCQQNVLEASIWLVSIPEPIMWLRRMGDADNQSPTLEKEERSSLCKPHGWPLGGSNGFPKEI